MRIGGKILALAFVTALSVGLARAGETAAGDHRVTGQYVEFCACDRLCESALEPEGRRSRCSFAVGLRIEAGQRGEISLGGLSAGIVAPAPAVEEAKPGNGPALYVDRAATPAQVEAIRAIVSERFGSRIGGSLGPTRPAAVVVNRTTEAVTLTIEGVADMRARLLYGSFGRPVKIENASGSTLGFPLLARGTGGQVADGAAGVTFDGQGRSVFYGKFDFGNGKLPGRKRK